LLAGFSIFKALEVIYNIAKPLTSKVQTTFTLSIWQLYVNLFLLFSH
jgi:hypothetical protein